MTTTQCPNCLTKWSGTMEEILEKDRCCNETCYTGYSAAQEERQIKRAASIAKDAHSGQKYNINDDYFDCHVEKVVDNLKVLCDHYKITSLPGGRCVAVCSAYLHDTVEDTYVTIKDVMDMFNPAISTIVDLLTKKTGEEYLDYLARVMTNPVAMLVKMADLQCNIHAGADRALNSYERQRRAKYQLAFELVKKCFLEKLPEVLNG